MYVCLQPPLYVCFCNSQAREPALVPNRYSHCSLVPDGILSLPDHSHSEPCGFTRTGTRVVSYHFSRQFLSSRRWRCLPYYNSIVTCAFPFRILWVHPSLQGVTAASSGTHTHAVGKSRRLAWRCLARPSAGCGGYRRGPLEIPAGSP